MKPITVQKFQSQDGNEFNTKEDCIYYEASLIINNIQKETKADLCIEFAYRSNYDGITDYLIVNKEHIKEFYKRLEELEKE